MPLEVNEDKPQTLARLARWHAAQRSPPAFLGFVVLVFVFVALLFVPAVASPLNFHRGTGLPLALTWLACTTVATIVYHRTGLSRFYLALDLVESIALQSGLCLLIYRSGSAVSIFWLAYLGHAQLIAGLGLSRVGLALIASGPTALGPAFWLSGDRGSALITLLVGIFGVFLFNLMGRVHTSLEAALAREVQLKNSLAHLRVAQERSRIARDLHDGVAGELAAIAWRLRQIPYRAEVNALETGEFEVNRLEERIRSVLENLRQVVLDLRQEHRTWVDVIAVLRERCQDLCGSRQLVFNVTGELGGLVPEGVAEDVVCIVGELVRNAAKHADPMRVEVQIHISDRIEIHVSDDGIGLAPDAGTRSSGGLANLLRRVASHGGELDIRSASPGTEILVRLPPSHAHGMVSSLSDS